MLKIGDFSRLSQIGIHALRNYDRLGLLQPEQIDEFTGYRYYTLAQLPRAHRIMALKGMGLSLHQIGKMINESLSLAEMQGMLKLKQTELEQRIHEEQQRLSVVRFHLKMLEFEGNMPNLNVVMRDIDAFSVLYYRMRPQKMEIDSFGLPGDVTEAGDEVIQTVLAQGIKWAGPQVDIRYGGEVNADEYEYAFCIPVEDSYQVGDIALPTKGKLVHRELPAVLAATAVHQGRGMDDVHDIVARALEAMTLLRRWCVENGYTLTDELRIVFHKFFNEGDWLVEHQQVVLKPESTD
jgi:DNA-binding transcriptional MerR regulator